MTTHKPSECVKTLLEAVLKHGCVDCGHIDGDRVRIVHDNGDSAEASGLAATWMLLGILAFNYGGCHLGMDDQGMWRVAFANVPWDMAEPSPCAECAIVGAIATVERLWTTGMVKYERD